MNPSEETISEAARGSWEPRSGVGSFLQRFHSVGEGMQTKDILQDKEGVESEDDGVRMR